MPPSIKDFFCRPNELRRIAKLAVSKAKDLKVSVGERGACASLSLCLFVVSTSQKESAG
jgi:hypothetical protein